MALLMINLDAMPIPLLKGKGFAWLSPQDVPLTVGRSWRLKTNKNRGAVYAYGNRASGLSPIPMHRLIMGLTANDGRMVDHIDGNGLNNTRENLRLATHAQNIQNRGAHRNNVLGLKGVSSNTNGGGYRARIRVRGETRLLGHCRTPEAAARVYDAWAKEAHGKFARLNFPGHAND